MKHAWSICRYLWCGPRVTCTVNRISIGPSMSPMVKNDFHHIWLCVKSLDGKVGQTIPLDWPHVVRVFVVVFRPITTFIFTNHNFHSIKSKDTRTINPRTCKNDQWRRVYRFWNHTKYVWGDFFTFCWRDKFLEMFHLTAVCISPHSPCKNLETRAWGMYAISIATMFWPPCLNPYFQTRSTFEKGDFAKFWISMDWDNEVHPMLWIVEGITL